MNSDYTIQKVLRKEEENLAKATAYSLTYLATFEELLEALPEDSVTRTSVSADCINLSCKGGKEDFVAILRALRTRGFTLTTRPKPNEPTFFSYAAQENGLKIWFGFSSTFCIQVPDGEEYIKITKYKVVCGDGDQKELEEALAEET